MRVGYLVRLVDVCARVVDVWCEWVLIEVCVWVVGYIWFSY